MNSGDNYLDIHRYTPMQVGHKCNGMGRVRKLTKGEDSHVTNSLNRLQKRISFFLGKHAH